MKTTARMICVMVFVVVTRQIVTV